MKANPPFPDGNRLRFWYDGCDGEHWQLSREGGTGTGTLRRDGFASWEAGDEEGSVTTCPLKATWASHIFLNLEAPHGEARLEILDADTRQPLPGCSRDDCLSVTGDQLRASVEFKKWRGTFIRHTGRVRLRFHLRHAKVYAFAVTGMTYE